MAGTLPATTTLLTPVILNRVILACSELIFTHDICHHPVHNVHPDALDPSMLLSYSHTNPHLQSCTPPTQSSCGGVLPPRSRRWSGSLACEGMQKMGEDLDAFFLDLALPGRFRASRGFKWKWRECLRQAVFSLTGHVLTWALARDAHVPALLANRRQWPSSGRAGKCQEGCHPFCPC